MTLFERCGGFAVVRRVVSTFYNRMLDSPRLQKHFGGTDMRTLVDHQTKFIASVMGGPAAFDRTVELFGCERIQTIGDAYVAVSELPEPNLDHAGKIAKVALRMRRYLERRNASHAIEWRCRIGVATGPAIGSLVGIQKYVYDIFVPAVNLAARLESLAEPMQILASEETVTHIRNDFVFTEVGQIEVKGFGRVLVHVIEDESGRGKAGL